MIAKSAALETKVKTLEARVQTLGAENAKLREQLAEFISNGKVKVSELPMVRVDADSNLVSLGLPPDFAPGKAVTWRLFPNENLDTEKVSKILEIPNGWVRVEMRSRLFGSMRRLFQRRSTSSLSFPGPSCVAVQK